MQPTRIPLEQFMRDKLDKCNYIKLENIIENLWAWYGYMHWKIIEVTDSQWSEFYDKIVCERIPYKNIWDWEMCDFFWQSEETKLIIAKLLWYEE